MQKNREEARKMNFYEVFIEDMNPCGGEEYARKEFIEVEAESPEAYVKANGRYPIANITTTADGDTVIVTDAGNGYIIRYTFSE